MSEGRGRTYSTPFVDETLGNSSQSSQQDSPSQLQRVIELKMGTAGNLGCSKRGIDKDSTAHVVGHAWIVLDDKIS